MTPVPSDEAVHRCQPCGGRGYTTSGYDLPSDRETCDRCMGTGIDVPRIRAEAAAEARAATLREVEAWIVNDAKWMDTRAERERWAREIAAHFNPEANEPQREEQ